MPEISSSFALRVHHLRKAYKDVVAVDGSKCKRASAAPHHLLAGHLLRAGSNTVPLALNAPGTLAMLIRVIIYLANQSWYRRAWLPSTLSNVKSSGPHSTSSLWNPNFCSISRLIPAKWWQSRTLLTMRLSLLSKLKALFPHVLV